MELSPTSLDFGEVVIGESANRSLTITNTGDALLEVSAITLPNGYKKNSDVDTYVLAKGTSVTITITFTPQNAAVYSGNITVQSNATTAQHTVAVTGKGVPVTAITDPAIPAPTIYPNPGTGIYTITTTQPLTSQNTQLLTAQGAALKHHPPTHPTQHLPARPHPQPIRHLSPPYSNHHQQHTPNLPHHQTINPQNKKASVLHERRLSFYNPVHPKIH